MSFRNYRSRPTCDWCGANLRENGDCPDCDNMDFAFEEKERQINEEMKSEDQKDSDAQNDPS